MSQMGKGRKMSTTIASSGAEFMKKLAPEQGGAVAQSAERATPGEEVPGSIHAVTARSLLVGLVSV